MKKIILTSMLIGSMFLSSCGNTSSPPSSTNLQQTEASKTNETTTVSFECQNSNSQKIRGQINLPKGVTEDSSNRLPLVILSHGFGDTRNGGNQFPPLVDQLKENGFVTIQFDFDGYGESEGNLIYNSLKTEMDDLNSVIDYAKTLPYIDTNNINLLGFSMGGAVTSLVAGERPDDIHSIILWEAAACIVDYCEKGILFGTTVTLDKLPEQINIPVPGGKSYTFGKAYIKDAIGLDIYGISSNFTKPVLIIQGDQDKLVPLSYAKRYKEIYSNADLILLSNGKHTNSGATLNRMIDLTVSMLKNQT